MSGFSETMMRERLQKLSNTAHSIQTLSMWILHHQKKHADPILDTWLKEVRSNTDNERLISLVNLANDVIQNARKRAPSFMASFYEVLQPAFNHVFNTVDLPYKKMVERIIAVWRDRQIYSKAQLDALAQCVQESSVSTPNLNSDPESPIKSSSPLDESNSPTTSPEVSKVSILRKLEDPASGDVKIRQLIAGYPEAIANPALLKKIKSAEEIAALHSKIEEAVPVVNLYCKRLKEELKDRQNLQFILMDYTKALDQANERNRALIASVRKRIHRLDTEKRQLESHIESLPDLSEINGTTTSLPPLSMLFKRFREGEGQ